MLLHRPLWTALCVLATAFASEQNAAWEQLADALGAQDAHSRAQISQFYGNPASLSASMRAHHACHLAGKVLSPGDYSASASPDYTNRTRVNWSNNCWQNASCFVSPLNAQEVSKLFVIINAVQPRFSIRSGGHDFNVNHSSVAGDGLVIDTRYLNNITLASDKKTAVVGTGAHWGDVYNALNGSGVSVNGGRSPNPGVGGQTLGGGIGWLSPIAGVTAAQVVAVDMVLPNGTLAHANETSNADLLWATRGGGANYGLITAYTFQTVPVGQLWYEARLYTADKNPQLISALAKYQALAEKDPNASMVYSLSESTAGPGSFVGFAYLKPVAHPAVFQPFYDVEAAAYRINSTFGTLADLAQNYNNPQYPDIPPERNYVVSIPHKADYNTYNASYNAFKQLAVKAAALGGVMAYGSQPMATAAIDASADTPLGLSRTVQDWIHVTMAWSNTSSDAQLYSIVHQAGNAIESAARANGANLRYRFMNDANAGQNALGSYGSANLQKLRSIALKYDPARVMQRLQNGGWLLRDAFSTD